MKQKYLEMDKEEAAQAAAKFQEVPVSRIESVEVHNGQIEYGLSGKVFNMSVRQAINYLFPKNIE